MQKKTEAGPFATPVSLVVFITGKCNAACSHCFYAKQLNNNDDRISLERFQLILESLSSPTHLSLTGGEAFILPVLGKYLEVAFTEKNVSSISIPTNGFFRERIIEIVTNVCCKFDKPLRIQVSLDGLAQTHDEIRALSHGYERAIAVAEWLRDAGQQHSQLSYVVSTTVMRRNLGEIIDLIGDLKQKGLNHKITFLRGNDFSTFNVPEEIIRADYNSLEVLPGLSELAQLEQNIAKHYPDFLDFYSQRKIDATLTTLEQRKRDLPCYAGTHDGVIFHDGTVGLCEQVVPFGHLSQWNWDLMEAWNSEEANSHRSLLRYCSCIHGCNISTAATSLER